MSKTGKKREPASAGESRKAGRAGRPSSKLSKSAKSAQPQKKPARRGGLQLLLFCVAAVAVSSCVYLVSANISDFDAFYHLGHARVYAERGLFTKAFPWVVYSIVSRCSSDIWYGFHLLLVPFSLIQNPLLHIKAGGIFLLVLLLLLFYFAMRRSQLAYPYLWPFMLLFSADGMMWRLATARPHIVSMGLTALLFAFLVCGGFWGVFLVSLALAFVHLSFFWLALLLALAVPAVRLFTEKTLEWRKPVAVLLGLAAGWLLRPNPIGAAKLLYVQTFQLLLEKQKGQIYFGPELAPLPARALAIITPFILLWLGLAAVALVALFLRRADLPPRSRTLLWSSLLLSILFFGMTMLVSKRTVDQWVPFAVFCFAACFSYFLDPRSVAGKPFLGGPARIGASLLGMIVFAVMVWLSTNSYVTHIRDPRAIYPYRFRAAAEWLRDHSRPGEIVFHVNVDVFPELFFWDKRNRYIGGMDPIFQYAYDPSRYWKARNLIVGDDPSHTWGTPQAGGAKPEDTYQVLRRDFSASYLFVEKNFTPWLYEYAYRDPRYSLCFDDFQAAVFWLVEPTRTAKP